MQKSLFAAVATAALLSGAAALPARAQDFPIGPGGYVEITSVTVDDGHFGDYATFLAKEWKDQEEFAKAQGWITGYEILANVNKRPGEPDLYLIERYKSQADAAESERRMAASRAHTKMNDTQMDAGSGGRAKYRHVIGSQLLQEVKLK